MIYQVLVRPMLLADAVASRQAAVMVDRLTLIPGQEVLVARLSQIAHPQAVLVARAARVS